MEASGVLGLLVAVLGVAAWRWGGKRSIVLDDRGPQWEAAYQLARQWGLALGLLGVLVLIGSARSCGAQ